MKYNNNIYFSNMSFPVLSAEELVAAFQGRIPEMQISEADLKKPTVSIWI